MHEHQNNIRLKAILFDFDGVLIKSMEDHFEGWRRALEEYGIDMAPEELYVREGAAVEELANQFTRKFNLPFDEASNIVEKKRRYYDEIKNVELYPDLLDTLNWAQERDLKLGVVSGGRRKRVYQDLEDFGIAEFFSAVVTVDDVFFTKPAPEPYLRAAEALKVQPEECVVVENAPFGIRSAKAANMRCIAITSTLSPMFLKEADVVSDSIGDTLNVLKKMY